MTKKEKRAAYQKKWREENKERIAKYLLDNKESIKAKQKVYRDNNPRKYTDEQVAIRKSKGAEWYVNNKEYKNSREKDLRLSKKDGLFTVYYLKEEHYAGQTDSIRARMRTHKNTSKRHVLDVEVLAKFETRKEALAFEAKLHDMGYYGKNNGC